MTTCPEEWLDSTTPFQEARPGDARCDKTINLGAPEGAVRPISHTTRVVGAGDDASALIIHTRRSGITIQLDVDWEIQRAKNLRANKAQPTFETTHEGDVLAGETCPLEIK